MTTSERGPKVDTDPVSETEADSSGPDSGEAILEVENFSKDYGSLVAVNDLSFSIKQGEFVTLLGPSGCGKSTTLHSIAGLRKPTSGQIYLHGDDITSTSPSRRNIGMVFQSTALFPHMTAAENIAYGLKMHGYSGSEVDERVNELLELVQLPDHGDHKPSELSGGQQQRIALVRAMAYEPDILLLDEPLTGLDRVLREEMRREIRRIHESVNITTLYVTHDQEEALSLSDRVVILKDGIKQQIGTPEEVYQDPANEFVAEFVGKSTKFEGEVIDTSPLLVDTGSARIAADPTARKSVGEKISLYVRPNDIEITREEVGAPNEMSVQITNITNLGGRAETLVESGDGTEILVETERFPELTMGETTFVNFPTDRVIAI
jgi:ABC-type Fe3+/spermidine/putrescine transport system ATPase subunit